MSLDICKGLTAKKPVYGLPESGPCWFVTYQDHHTRKKKIIPAKGHHFLLKKRNYLADFIGSVVLLVDDSFGHGDEEFLGLEVN